MSKVSHSGPSISGLILNVPGPWSERAEVEFRKKGVVELWLLLATGSIELLHMSSHLDWVVSTHCLSIHGRAGPVCVPLWHWYSHIHVWGLAVTNKGWRSYLPAVGNRPGGWDVWLLGLLLAVRPVWQIIEDNLLTEDSFPIPRIF